MQARLALEDGTIMAGLAFGYSGQSTGEVVFNTSMTGYQEILTDPSYAGQIVTMTYPLIGNYGLNEVDTESSRPHVRGFVIRERSRIASNYRSQRDLEAYLAAYQIIGLEGIDTRSLAKHIRTEGAMRGVVSTEDKEDDELVRIARAAPPMKGQDLARTVTCPEQHVWTEGLDGEFPRRLRPEAGGHFKVAVLDFGIKHNILRCLVESGCEVEVFPASAEAGAVLENDPDGVFLSNGPGDPEPLDYAIECVRELLGKKPIFGICLGHQIMGLALGGKTSKLKFGHRGANQPVKDLSTGKVEITSQNHSFVVEPETLPEADVEVTHINLNDQTVEGLKHRHWPAFSVQYHPEASPGPHDALYLFQRFTRMMSTGAPV